MASKISMASKIGPWTLRDALYEVPVMPESRAYSRRWALRVWRGPLTEEERITFVGLLFKMQEIEAWADSMFSEFRRRGHRPRIAPGPDRRRQERLSTPEGQAEAHEEALRRGREDAERLFREARSLPRGVLRGRD
jgi:hypothetical protein